MTTVACLLLFLGGDAGTETSAPCVCAVAPAQPGEIRAEDRDRFEQWVDELAARWNACRAGRGQLDDDAVATLAAELLAAGVDVSSFLIRGPENHDFPRMLFHNQFFRYPLYRLHPATLVRTICRRKRPAVGTTSDGDVPHSTFFTKTCISSYTPERLVAEFNEFQPAGKMTITKVKEGGTSEGLWIKDERGRVYILVFDPPFDPEMTTSAEYIGSTLLRMAGYQVPKTCICDVRGTGNSLYDGRRAVSTISLDHFKGGWRYDTFSRRREVRALQVFGGWIGNVDQTEQNTGVTVNDDGVCRHYVLDFGASLGSFTFRPQMARLGWTRLFDAYQQFTQPLYNIGLRRVPWEAPYRVQSASVGYFTSNYDPDRWQPFYRNMGFVEVTEADRIWAARRIAQFSDEQIRAVVALAGYTHAFDRDVVTRTLLERRDIIVRRYLRGEGIGK